MSVSVGFVRRNVWTLNDGGRTLNLYGQAVTEMKRRSAADPADPTGWTYQAAIHGTYDPQVLWGYNTCEHGSWYFLPWHRMYVYWFEQIVRSIIGGLPGGTSEWSLPYWDYTKEGQGALPDPFRDASDPLFVAQRAQWLNAGGAFRYRVLARLVAMSLGQSSFTGGSAFGGPSSASIHLGSPHGAVESQPHDTVHSAVGGKDPVTGQLGLMGDVPTAALDPIFWLHHANIDRLWDQWDTAGTRAPTDSSWATTEFELFGPDKKRVSRACGTVVNLRDLRYVYDTTAAISSSPPRRAPVPTPSEPSPELLGANSSALVLSGAPASTVVRLDDRALRSAIAVAPASSNRQVLSLDNIEAERNPGTVYGVYINLPESPTASDKAAHFAGTFSLFGIETANNPIADRPAHGARVLLDVSKLVEDLRSQGRWDGTDLRVSFEPLSLIAPPEAASPPHTSMIEPAPEVQEPVQHDPVTIGRVALFSE